MDHVITVKEVLIFVGVIGGIFGILAVVFFILSVIGEGFKH